MLFRPYSNVSAQPQSLHTLILISHLCCRLTPQMLALGLFLHSTTGMGGTSHCLCKLHPISQRERNYSTMENNAPAVVIAMKHFWVYQLGRKFNVITDSSALRWLHSLEPKGRRTPRSTCYSQDTSTKSS